MNQHPSKTALTKALTCVPLMLALVSVCFTTLSAESFAEDEKPAKKKIRWYKVEMIIFSQQDLFNDERHISDIELSYPNNLRRLTDSPAAPSQPFVSLPKNEMTLMPDHTSLNHAAGYRVLYHKMWRQPGFGIKDSPWILVQGGKATGDHHELEGSIRLVRNRHLHIQTDLWKTKFISPNTQSNFISTDQQSWPSLPPKPGFGNQAGESQIEGHQLERNTASNNISDIVTLKQSTRLTRNELTYMDHPNMGVIVRVTRDE